MASLLPSGLLSLLIALLTLSISSCHNSRSMNQTKLSTEKAIFHGVYAPSNGSGAQLTCWHTGKVELAYLNPHAPPMAPITGRYEIQGNQLAFLFEDKVPPSHEQGYPFFRPEGKAFTYPLTVLDSDGEVLRFSLKPENDASLEGITPCGPGYDYCWERTAEELPYGRGK